MKTKKELKQEYKLMKFRQGIFQILNKQNNRMLLQISSDLDRAYNLDKFQLKAGLHSNQLLQNDWNALGSEMFEFKIFDEHKVNDTDTPTDIKQDLKELLEMHLYELKKKEQLFY